MSLTTVSRNGIRAPCHIGVVLCDSRWQVGGEGAEPEIGRKIREARLARGWTHEELARRMDVNWRTVQRWQKGNLPRVDSLRRLATVLDVPPSYFLESDGPASLSDLQERLSELSDRIERLTAVVASLPTRQEDHSNGGG